jgi:hypothetical protein
VFLHNFALDLEETFFQSGAAVPTEPNDDGVLFRGVGIAFEALDAAAFAVADVAGGAICP